MNKMSLILVFSVGILILSACTRDKSKELDINEFLKVEGTCIEDHVGIVGEYKGTLYSGRVGSNNKDESYRRVGSVHLTKEMMDNNVKNIISTLYKYKVPYDIQFRDIPQEEFSKPEMKIHGISNYYSKEDTAYESTCRLKVVERLDHYPELKKKAE